MIGLEACCNYWKISYKELADKLEIKPPNITNWIKGKKTIPKIQLRKLSEIFSGLPEELIGSFLSDVNDLKINIFYLENVIIKNEGADSPYSSGGIDSKTNGEILKVFTRNLKYWEYLEEIEIQTRNVTYATDKSGNFDDFYMKRLIRYLDFMKIASREELNIMDSIFNYLNNYSKEDRDKWIQVEMFPNEKKLEFYSDLEELFNKHNILF